MFSHSSIVHNAPIITYDIIVSLEQCLNANKTGKINVTKFDDDEMEIDIKHGIKLSPIKTRELILKVIHQHLVIIVVKLNIFLLKP